MDSESNQASDRDDQPELIPSVSGDVLAPPVNVPEESVHPEEPNVSKPSRKTLVIVAAVVLTIAVSFSSGWAIHQAPTARPQVASADASINPQEYQSIFLANGQVYFGKLSNLGQKYITITNIYYLQVQQGGALQSTATSTDTNNSQVALAKLGNELHGPEDKMFIASDQILFWENMKNDSKVTQAISQYQTK